MAKSNPIDEAKDLQQMLVEYAKQETVEPLKTLGRFLGMGFGGSLLVFLGFFFLGLGTLRGFQSIDSLEGSSWGSTVPYLATLVLMAVVAFVLVFLNYRSSRRKVEERPFP